MAVESIRLILGENILNIHFSKDVFERGVGQ